MSWDDRLVTVARDLAKLMADNDLHFANVEFKVDGVTYGVQIGERTGEERDDEDDEDG